MRPKKHETTGSADLFRARLDQIINMRHELVQLAGKIDWEFIDGEIAPLYSDGGRPGIATQFVIGLFFLGLRRIEWVILGVEDSTNLGIARGFCILAGLYLASMMDGTNIETPSAAVGYVFVSGFSAGADSTRDFR